MSEAARRRIVRVSPVVAAGSRFEKYKPEEEKGVRKVEVKEDEVLRQLKAAWGKYRPRFYEEYYPDALKAIRNISYSASDVEKFSLALVEFQGEERFSDKAGLFLSALINNGKDIHYVIHTEHLAEVFYLGTKNTKNIIVNGNAGSMVGDQMEGGSIIVNGNAGYGVGGHMEGGTIIVNGTAGDHVGVRMKGGAITVNGNAGNDVGTGMMEGAVIHLNGGYKSIADDVKGGKIYHEGVLIVDK